MKEIIIIGAGGFAREVAWLIEEINKITHEWKLLGYIEEYKDNIGKNLNGYEVLGDFNWIKENNCNNLYYVCGVADPTLKERFVLKAEELGLKAAVLIHPNVQISNYNNIEEGVIICSGCIITVNIHIKRHVIVNIDSTIGHDAVIEEYSTILPSVNISGNVVLGTKCLVGTSSAIIEKVSIGDNVTIGAGSVVVRDIPSNCVVVGVPGKVIKQKD
ncbi:acetyltransferase [Alloiococcus sp. CFN-8]|uniref:acetyltransferase n=1 Tax=Alloiococcus sp. CFN-8 TaxID=3416081 RepID=UPI003CF5EB0E